mmetsp:Transcript_37083/g.106063  ORF Transcript_37083/g.106063 Transcript_37083/m.106063 type:complete len:372 (+) Transcript_37083:289-1404(+)
MFGRRATSTGSRASAPSELPSGGMPGRPGSEPSSASPPATLLPQTTALEELLGRTSKSSSSCETPPRPELETRLMCCLDVWLLLFRLPPVSTKFLVPTSLLSAPPLALQSGGPGKPFFTHGSTTAWPPWPVLSYLQRSSRSSRCQTSSLASLLSRSSFTACASTEIASTFARISSISEVFDVACFPSSSCRERRPRTSRPCCETESSMLLTTLSMLSICSSRRVMVFVVPSRSRCSMHLPSFCRPRPWRRMARHLFARSTSPCASDRLMLSCCTMRCVCSTSRSDCCRWSMTGRSMMIICCITKSLIHSRSRASRLSTGDMAAGVRPEASPALAGASAISGGLLSPAALRRGPWRREGGAGGLGPPGPLVA